MERIGLRASPIALLASLASCAIRVSSAPADAGAESAVECVSGADCDDQIACTAERCVQGRCERAPLDLRCGADERCEPGVGCRDPRCDLGRRSCEVRGGALRCVDLDADREHCGGCDRACGLGERCLRGACVRSPGEVGARCVAPGDCAEGLRCDESRNGLCTRACEDYGDDDAAEAAACGGASRRCVRGETAPACLLGCDPLARAGSAQGCAIGEVCTGGWWLDPRYLPDAPGCVRWCSADADCAGDPRGARCNPRLGRCAAEGEDRSRAPDGSPCDPRESRLVEGDPLPRSATCRGFCARAGSSPSEGICGSFVDRSRFARCPDDAPDVSMRGPFGADNLALCLWRRCGGDCECRGALRCLLPESQGRVLTAEPRFCAWPTAAQPSGQPCR